MKELVVISGKGGTGKTSIVSSFAVLARNKVMADCDVDAANLHLMLSPQIKERHQFYGLPKARIDREKCVDCGLCEKYCRFDAVKDNHVNPLACEGCAVCSRICPEGAIEMVDTAAGEWFKSDTGYGPLIHARLGAGQENSGKLVALVRKQAEKTAKELGCDLIITDGPPGIGCPVIASLGGAALALIITEPSLPGIHDLERILDLTGFFGVPAMVCINKWDIDPENTESIKAICRKRRVPFAGQIPYDGAVMLAAARGKPVIEMTSGLVNEIESLWKKVFDTLCQK